MKTLKKINDGFIKVSEYVAFVLSCHRVRDDRMVGL